MVSNGDIARVLYEIADYLTVATPSLKASAHKARAYREAAKFIEHSRQQLNEVFEEGGEQGLIDLPEVGESMAKKIAELLETGKLAYLEKLRKKLPVEMYELTAIEGVGPKTVDELYKKLKVKTVADLERAAKSGLIRDLPGFGEKSEKDILQGIRLKKKNKGRLKRETVEPVAKRIVAALKKLPEVSKVETAGSIRRKNDSVGDIDLVAASTKPSKVMGAFVQLPDVDKVLSKGNTKTMVRLKQGIDADLRVVEPKSYGAALQYFTGPKEHSIATRKLARKKGMKLNEYGLYKGTRQMAGKTEREIYRALGLKYQKPEERSSELPEG